jgi:DNA invertase Pin-like site-specific DNA recombinase
MQVARIYLRVSTGEQDLARQASIEERTRLAGYYIAGVYREKASGARADRPELLRMIADLQPGEVVVAEKIDRISRLPLPEAEQLVESIRTKGARLAIPGLVDLSEIASTADGVTRIVLEAVQELLLKLALQMARDDYETRRERQRQGVQLAKAANKYRGRIPDITTHQRIISLRRAGESIKRTAELAGCSQSQVKRIYALHQTRAHDDTSRLPAPVVDPEDASTTVALRESRDRVPKNIGSSSGRLPDRIYAFVSARGEATDVAIYAHFVTPGRHQATVHKALLALVESGRLVSAKAFSEFHPRRPLDQQPPS